MSEFLFVMKGIIALQVILVFGFILYCLVSVWVESVLKMIQYRCFTPEEILDQTSRFCWKSQEMIEEELLLEKPLRWFEKGIDKQDLTYILYLLEEYKFITFQVTEGKMEYKRISSRGSGKNKKKEKSTEKSPWTLPEAVPLPA